MNHILINATHKEEIRVGVVKNKKLTGLNIETSLNKKTKGNIYRGKISRVEQSLEAAFVDYGKERQGFLPFKEVAESLYNGATPKGAKLTISDVLKEGQEIIVQVEKEERGNKGAALSTYINLAGAYMILTPNNAKSHGISRQITSSDRQSLKEIIGKIVMPKNSGLIIRTAGSGKSLEELQWEVDYLSDLWKSINIAAEKRPAPFLIYQESDIIIRTLRDHLRSDTDSVIIDELEAFQNAKEFVSFVLPQYLDRIKFFDVTEHSLFNHMGVENQVKSVFNREVALRTGATIVFDPTEALTAVDINSARATKGSDIEETAYNTNLEAAKEIALQLQLRDIGGLVVIDFIDMATEEHRQAIEKAMETATQSDRARIQIGNISKFGLLEMSRQRLMSSVTESVEKSCPACHGRGTTPTIPTLALSILRQLEDGCNASNQTSRITIQSSVEVITYILNEKRQDVTRLEIKHGIKITLLPNPYMQFPNFSINKQKGSKKSQHKSYQGISKPQQTLAENGLADESEIPAVNMNRPQTRVPEKTKEVQKLSLIARIKAALFGKRKNKPSQKKANTNNKNRNKNRNRNRNRNKPANQNQQNKSKQQQGQAKKQGNKQPAKQQNNTNQQQGQAKKQGNKQPAKQQNNTNQEQKDQQKSKVSQKPDTEKASKPKQIADKSNVNNNPSSESKVQPDTAQQPKPQQQKEKEVTPPTE
ncbi:Rne/Rng family ribonuclease [Candidatus Thioglobus autotrophicus]|uniref:Rne/Rng family ribonuclease n=1 Tax=Candidatus Thioglobus autotrophicus TaxID=1705394 RepID=UPI00299F4426|nr:Rne/Rng family ribonuclease [Candidatus Thioglobus autotrophicus]WPE17414.1 Rne/Rng family ribonuclease [Candidatus Thioglobus autotrophicus]